MSLKALYQRLNIDTSVNEERQKFINRIDGAVFNHERLRDNPIVFIEVCYILGLDGRKMMREHYCDYREICKEDFMETLKVLTAICSYVGGDLLADIDDWIRNILDQANVDLGVRWIDGIFIPSGDEYLDAELVGVAHSLLGSFPNVKKDLEDALKSYSEKNYNAVLGTCYTAVEDLSKHLIGNTKNLDANKDALIKSLKLPVQWKDLLANYLKFSHEYARHAGSNRHEKQPQEVEAFLYMTCLLIRLILQSIKLEGQNG